MNGFDNFQPDPEPPIQNPEPPVQNPEPPAQNPEPPAQNPEPPALSLSLERRQIAMPLLAVVCIYLATMLLQAAAIKLVNHFVPHLWEEGWFLIVMSNTPLYLCGMPLSLLIFRFAKASPPAQKKLRFSALLGLIPICFCITILGSIISTVISTAIEAITGQAPSNELQELTQNTPLWANLLYVGILAPILEEIFFRKLVIDRWRRYGDLIALSLSGLAFGLVHGNVGQVVYASLGGMLFGYIYLRTGRLRYTITLHMIINMSSVVMTEVLKRLDLEALSTGSLEAFLKNMTPLLFFGGYLCFLLLCFVTAPIAIALFWRHIRFERGETRLTAGQWVKAGLLNPAVWLFFGLVVFMFAG